MKSLQRILSKIFRFIFVFVLITAWVFSPFTNISFRIGSKEITLGLKAQKALAAPPLTEIIAQDTFTDSNGTLLQNHTSDSGHSWVKRNAQVADFDIQANTARNTTSPSATTFLRGYHINVDPGNSEYEVEFVGTHSSSASTGDRLRVQIRYNADPSVDTGYEFEFRPNLAFFQRRVTGAVTLIGDTITKTFTANTPYKMRVRTYIDGNGDVVLEGYIDDELIVSVTDNSVNKITDTGRGGFGGATGGTGRTISWDNFELRVPNTIAISGTLYSDEGTTAVTSGETISLYMATSTDSVATSTTSDGSGNYSFAGLEFPTEGTPFTMWVDNDATFRASAVASATTTSGTLLNMHLYQNRVALWDTASSTGSSANATSTTIAMLNLYDNDNDDDIQFKTDGSSLNILAGNMLYIGPGTTFAPGGNVTIHGNAQQNDTDGSIRLAYGRGAEGIATSSLVSMNGSSLTVGGSWFASSTPITSTSTYFFPGAVATTFTATTTGKSIYASSTPFYNLTFDGVDGTGGGWTFREKASTTNDFTITDGTVVAPSWLSIGGDYTNNGTFTAGTGTTTFDGTSIVSGALTGSSAFNNVEITSSGDGGAVFLDDAASSHFFLQGGSTTFPTAFSISGNFKNNGTFNANSGTTTFNGTSQQYISGFATGTNAFAGLEILNTTASTTFTVAASSTGMLTASAGARIEFKAGATTTVQNISLNGSGGNEIYLHGNGIGWYDPDWLYRKNITLKQASTTLTNFPALVSLSDTDLASRAQSDGDDILFTSSDGTTRLSHEIDTYASGGLTAWVKIPTLSSSAANDIYMYYGNSATSSEETPSAVWDSNYMGVWHLNESVTDEGTVSDAYQDSTQYVNHGDQQGPVNTMGKFGQGQSFDGNDYIDLSRIQTYATSTGFTISVWNNSAAQLDRRLYAEASSASNNPIAAFGSKTTTGATARMYVRNDANTTMIDSDASGVKTVWDSTWHYATWTDDPAGTGRVYVDGSLDHTSSYTPAGTYTMNKTALGAILRSGPSWQLTGTLDEARVSRTTRSADWIAIEYDNQSATSTFYTAIGGEESIQWNFEVPGGRSVSYVNVKDSNACYTSGNDITATNSTDGGNNDCWGISAPVAPGTLAISNHDAGQESNKFNTSILTDEEFFGFKLTPTSEAITTTLVFSLAAFGVSQSDVTNVQLFPDYNGDGNINGDDSEDPVGGSGTVSIVGNSGTITFSGFSTSTVMNYILQADVTDINPGDELSISLNKAKITATGVSSGQSITPSGTALLAVHSRSGGGSVGAGGKTGDSVTAQETQTGGSGGGGEPLLSSDDDNKVPGSSGTPSNLWSSGGNGIASDDAYASETTDDEGLNFNVFGFNVPTGDTINGIEVKIEASCVTTCGSIDVALTWDNDGTNATTTAKNTGTITTTDTIYTLGGSTDTWGRSWSASEFSDANFSVEVIAQPSGSNAVRIDAITARVYHQSTGGGGGGGGRSYIPPGWFIPPNIYASNRGGARNPANTF